MKKGYFIKMNSRNEVIKMDKHKPFYDKSVANTGTFHYNYERICTNRPSSQKS